MKLIKYIAWSVLLVSPMFAVSCGDMNGDGQGEIEWTGSKNPENTQYRNPVWEPSLAGGTVMRTASDFVAISSETEWAVGLPYACPVLYSNDLMKWNFNSQTAFTYPKAVAEGEEAAATNFPTELTSKINSVSADFFKTVSGTSYWLFYGEENGKVIGVSSATTGRGPYTPQGVAVTAEELGAQYVEHPYVFVVGASQYLVYTTETGTYVQRMMLRRGAAPNMMGQATLIAGPGMTDACIYSNGDQFYLLITVATENGTEIRYGMSDKVDGSYVDKSGNDMASGSKGELLVEAGNRYEKPCNPMRIFANNSDVTYLCYNATERGLPTMASGSTRQPMFLNVLEIGEDGWFTNIITPVFGWSAPRF